MSSDQAAQASHTGRGLPERPRSPMARRVEVLGSPFDPVTEAHALERTLDWCRNPGDAARIVVTVNAAILMMMRRDARLTEAVQNADLVVADGAPVVWASRWLGQDLPGRVTGVDLMVQLLEEGKRSGLRIFLLGTTPVRLDTLSQVIKSRYPGIEIVGSRHGYFGPDEHEHVVKLIRDSAPQLLLLGMPAPMKEVWCEKYRDALGAPVVLGVGGAFDVLGGYVTRAPSWMQSAGLEWTWRLMKEPRKLWKRYLLTNSEFVIVLFQALARRALSRGRSGRRTVE
jgi:N-acetylglucosaminyldiphosphoundecaprenol N-acetyl-beta-D-mannosaminyltransferase